MTRALRVRALSALLSCSCFALSAPASAQANLGGFARAIARAAKSSLAQPLPHSFTRGRGGGVPLIVRAPGGAQGTPGLVSVGDFAAGELEPGRLLELALAHPDWVFDWAPPRHALLDRIEGWVHAQSVREQTQTSGQGVIVGIVDTGAELTHGDLRTAEGRTRVAWWFDTSRSADGLQPELETRYGCSAKPGCAIYSGEDLDLLTSNDISGDEPSDPYGHGTHVASLAAGNGLASGAPRYVGVAPEATLIIARVAQADGGIQDADVLTAVSFIFDRAEELGMPAVVNLSLGSDFGAHDGNSALEQGLSSLVGPAFPGRAIVVAAGNSAGLSDGTGLDSAYPGPFGIHSEVAVPHFSITRVPLITPALSGSTVSGSAYVWLGFREGDDVSVGFETKNGVLLGQVHEGKLDTYQDSRLELVILNGATKDESTLNPGRNSAVIALSGEWAESNDFRIRLEGHGTAELWVQGQGDLNPELGFGAVFSRAAKQGTINVPASASQLIAVGATLNRTSWVDVSGERIDLPSVGALENAPLDTVAFFSSAGPNALGALKPDIVAPGVFVAGAMARSVDPRRGPSGLFSSQGRCPGKSECFVVDEAHAITSGTSMSAPIVTGAIALLFQRDPKLTQDAARAILQAGARQLEGVVIDPQQIGPGALDLQGALDVATSGESPALRIPSAKSWLSVSASHVHADPEWPVTGYLDLRDDDGKLADGFDAARLHLTAEPANIREPLTRVAPGFYRFQVTAPVESGGQTMHLAVSFDEAQIAKRDLPIIADPELSRDGLALSGACSFSGTSTSAGTGTLLIAVGAWLRRRRHMRAK